MRVMERKGWKRRRGWVGQEKKRFIRADKRLDNDNYDDQGNYDDVNDNQINDDYHGQNDDGNDCGADTTAALSTAAAN